MSKATTTTISSYRRLSLLLLLVLVAVESTTTTTTTNDALEELQLLVAPGTTVNDGGMYNGSSNNDATMTSAEEQQQQQGGEDDMLLVTTTTTMTYENDHNNEEETGGTATEFLLLLQEEDENKNDGTNKNDIVNQLLLLDDEEQDDDDDVHDVHDRDGYNIDDDIDDVGSDFFYKGLTSSMAMIIATEIGDKTFFIAAVLSMKHDRLAVFGGSIFALIIMTILSTIMGYILLPIFISRKYTNLLGGILFLYFGIRLLYEARDMDANKTSNELEEVQDELHITTTTTTKKKHHASSHHHHDDNNNNNDIEAGVSNNNNNRRRRRAVLLWYRVFMQALTLTFLAEWGDRSQIATIALAASNDPIGVTIGGCIGHTICTGLAVLGGSIMAQRISERTVTILGGIIFLLFGLQSVFIENIMMMSSSSSAQQQQPTE